jgi:hypothetical protein
MSTADSTKNLEVAVLDKKVVQMDKKVVNLTKNEKVPKQVLFARQTPQKSN